MEKTVQAFKGTPLIYEFIGTAFVSAAFNSRQGNYPIGYGIASLWCWTVSPSHFNFSFTMGSLVANYNSKPIRENLLTAFTTFLAQVFGSIFGIGLSYVCT